MQDRHLHCNSEVVDSDVMGADDNLATVQVKRGSGLPGLGTQDSHSLFFFCFFEEKEEWRNAKC